jgi:hypothetical protein
MLLQRTKRITELQSDKVLRMESIITFRSGSTRGTESVEGEKTSISFLIYFLKFYNVDAFQ